MATPLAAVVLCAGKGTRMKSDLPKVLHPLLGVPLCTYPLRRALSLGAHPVVPVVGHQAQAVETAVRALFPEAPLTFALQSEQRGTAHAVGCAKEALQGFTGRILILYGDTPLLREETLSALLAAHARAGGPLAMMTMVADNPQGYGRVLREGGRVVGVVEQKDCTPEQARVKECNAGIYSVDASFLWRALSEVKPQNVQGEYYLTDIVAMAAREGEVATLTADMAETAGVNDRVDLAHCTRVLQSRINTALMRAGVTMVDPTSAWIAEDVRFGTDCEVGPQVSVGPGCQVGSRVVLEQGCHLSRSRVGDGTHLKPYSVLEEAEVGVGCHVGPFARLRPGTQLAEGVHIGNFVETKKARLGKGSKANHLAYLGDARIGAGVNVGAGTITCNYDGVAKHETVLGDGVFIGSDTQLVAPVTVGAGAYVGAGSTVTKDVPPGALAISRTPQSNVEGWAEKKRARQQAERQQKVHAGGGEPSR